MIIILTVLIVTAIVIKPYDREIELEFEFVDVIENVKADDLNYRYWFTLRDEKYSGFVEASILDEYEYDTSIFDFDNYTYVITLGHELKKIEYNFAYMKNRIYIVFPKQFIGKVTLNSVKTNDIYIYKIRKMDIDYDYHDPSKRVVFE